METTENNSAPAEDTITRKPVNKIYLIIAVLLAGVLLFLALKDIDWPEMWTALQQARLEYLLLFFALSSCSVFFRGMRWGVLISAQKKVSTLTMFWSTAVGYLGNTLLPARAGEVIRSIMLGSHEHISKSYVFATALTERILDVIILLLLGIFSIPAIGEMPSGIHTAMRVMGILGVAAILLLLLAPRHSDTFFRFVNWLPLPEKAKKPLNNFLGEFLLGAQAFQNPKRAAKFAGYSAVIWFLDATGAVMMSYALQLQFTYPQAFVLLMALGLSSAIPSTPGYVGIYQYVAVMLLPIYGINRTQALTYILLMQLMNILNILVWGFIGLRQMNMRSLNDIR